MIAASVPLEPLNLQRVTLTTTTVSFEWEEKSDDGGSPVIDYKIYWDAGDVDLSETDFVLSASTSYQTLMHE
jgi:hypothetical protein